MAWGAVGVLLALTPFYIKWLPAQEFYMKAFYVALPAFLGVVAGRVFSSWWAARKLRQMDLLLYEQEEPEEFIRVFAPLVRRAPVNTIEYVNGCVKLAYACEAMGRFEESLLWLQDVKPEQLQLHGLAARALVANQRARDYLLLGDTQQAGICLAELRELWETADGRAPALASGLKECVRLVQVWLDFLTGEDQDEAYISEEMELAKNRIYRAEMGLLLARMKMVKGDREESERLLVELTEMKDVFYTGREAARLLGRLRDREN